MSLEVTPLLLGGGRGYKYGNVSDVLLLKNLKTLFFIKIYTTEESNLNICLRQIDYQVK